MSKNALYFGLILLLGALTRLLPHPPNVAPLAALGLASAAFMSNKRLALLLPIIALFISDCLLTLYAPSLFLFQNGITWYAASPQGFHATMPFVYASVLATIFLGFFLLKRVTALRIMSATLLGSLAFFLITNFGVWLTGGGLNYPKSFLGLLTCYEMALPFLHYSLLGDVFFALVFFGSAFLVQRYSARKNLSFNKV